MGRPKGGQNINHSKEEKLKLVLRNLSGETARSIERELLKKDAELVRIKKEIELEGGNTKRK